MATTAFALTGRTEVVHLRDVPEKLRMEVAERIIAAEGLTGTREIDMKMAAIAPRHATIEVDVAKADRVRQGRVPPGPQPKW